VNTTEADYIITQEDLDHIEKKLGKFRPDGRVGINHTLHRISKVSDREGNTVGFTFRIGRYLTSKPTLIEDLIGSDKSILIIAPPGRGKSSMLRQIAFILSINYSKRVIVVDKSSELGGESNPAHYSLGKARRFQVPEGKTQADTMLFALESHFPQVMIVDEISTFQEAEAARTIGQRGVQLIATAHGRKIEDIIKNPPLSSLLGGINIVTLSDENAKIRQTTKTVSERKFDPTFDIVIEINAFDEIAVYDNVTEAIDNYLIGGKIEPEIRRVIGGQTRIIQPKTIKSPRPSYPLYEDSFMDTPKSSSNGTNGSTSIGSSNSYNGVKRRR
jgi:stage III sporulation protein SpoIIIAA